MTSNPVTSRSDGPGHTGGRSRDSPRRDPRRRPDGPDFGCIGRRGDDLAVAASGRTGGLRDHPSMEPRQALAKILRGRRMSPPQRRQTAPANASHDGPGNPSEARRELPRTGVGKPRDVPQRPSEEVPPTARGDPLTGSSDGPVTNPSTGCHLTARNDRLAPSGTRCGTPGSGRRAPPWTPLDEPGTHPLRPLRDAANDRSNDPGTTAEPTPAGSARTMVERPLDGRRAGGATRPSRSFERIVLMMTRRDSAPAAMTPRRARHSWIGHRPRSLACPPRTLDQVVNASFLAIRANSRCARAL